ncbi:MAG: methyltransferase domain-containing protein [Magnetococcales bacterium]|nr:methyltransferase domain-containing protein [Magnetococcales bacterium]
MKKDYSIIKKDARAANEVDQVQTFWSGVWEHRPLTDHAQQDVQEHELHPLVDSYLSTLPEGSRILDAGCGMGEWTIYYTHQGKHITGMDLSADTIQRLLEKYPECDFVTGDIRQTGFAPDTFDAIISWGTFEHFEIGLAPCFQEAWRILKPGGHLIITVPFHNFRHWLRDLFLAPEKNMELVHDPKDVTHVFYQWRLTRSELAIECLLHGFEVKKIIPCSRKSGMKRFLQHEFGVRPGTPLYRPLFKLFDWLLPRGSVEHMILGISTKADKQRGYESLTTVKPINSN